MGNGGGKFKEFRSSPGFMKFRLKNDKQRVKQWVINVWIKIERIGPLALRSDTVFGGRIHLLWICTYFTSKTGLWYFV